MSENKAAETKPEWQIPEIGSLWVRSGGHNVPCAIYQIAESDGNLLIGIARYHLPIAQFHQEWKPCTIIAVTPPNPAAVTTTDITNLMTEYETALTAEAIARLALDDTKAELSVIEAQARENARKAGRIDGPNAETRRDQAMLAVADVAIVKNRAAMTAKFERDYADAKVAREAAEMRCKLYRAWLNSQSGSH